MSAPQTSEKSPISGQSKSASQVTAFKSTCVYKRGRYVLGKCLGQGQFGKVFEAIDAKTSCIYAAKQFLANKRGWTEVEMKEIALHEEMGHVRP